MAKNFRDVGQKAVDVQAKADRIRATDPAGADALDYEAVAYRSLAADMEDRERRELEGIVRDGKPISGDSLSGGAVAEVRGFLSYLETGKIENAMSYGNDASGGILVPEPLHAELIAAARKADPIFGNARVFEVNGDPTMILPYRATGAGVANAPELGARSETASPTFTAQSLTCYDYYTDTRVSQTMLDSLPSGGENLILEMIYGDLWEQAGVDFAVGDGVGKASGLFAGTSYYQTMLSGVAGAITNTNFLTAYTTLNPRYRGSAAWIMSSATLAVAMGFASPASATEPLVQWVNGSPFIWGRPVLESGSAPEISGTSFPIAFADIRSAYAIGVHRQPSIVRDGLTQVPLVKFMGLARVGGVPHDPGACVLIKSNNN